MAEKSAIEWTDATWNPVTGCTACPARSIDRGIHLHRAARRAIRNLQAANTLALDDDLAVPRAQFDLTNVTAHAVNLLGDQGRAGKAGAGLKF
jgi:hypothetical protein